MRVRKFLSMIFVLLLLVSCKSEKREVSEKPAKKEPKVEKRVEEKTKVEINEKSVELTAIGKILAGVATKDGGKYDKYVERESYKKHYKKMASLWKTNQKERVDKIIPWRDKFLKADEFKNGVVFYPFGGPDILYPIILFPEESEYYLIGLEPVGSPINLFGEEEKEFSEDLKMVNFALEPILQISFFRTNDMKKELKEPGVTPILMTILCGMGEKIVDIKPLYIQSDGKLSPSEWGKKKTRVVEIDFLKENEDTLHKLFYLSFDLSDGGISLKKNFGKFLESLNPQVTFIKAATYLLHKSYFSKIRNYIVLKSSSILQDDSGIPFKYFSEGWSVQLFGKYDKPIDLFKEHFQKDLLYAYRNSKVEELPFGIGYHHRPRTSNLLLARKNR